MILPSIAILGATGNVGEALLTRLASSEFAEAEVFPYASRAMRRDTVELGGRTLSVRPLAEALDGGVSVALSALPPAIAQKTVMALAARGTLVVDIGNQLAGLWQAPLTLPGVRPIDGAGLAAAGGARTPSPTGWLLASVLAPLLPLGAYGVTGLVNLPANAFGRGATEELSEQVVATFNLKDPPRRHFAEGLAFDTLPEDADGGEWSAAEQLAAAEVSELLGLNPNRIAVQLCTQPVFAGMSAGLFIRGSFGVEAAERALRDAPGLASAGRLRTVRPRRVLGRPAVYWAGLRADPAGEGVHVWVAADNAAGAGAAVPVAVLEGLVRAGLLSRLEA